jgi:hypothetical protein
MEQLQHGEGVVVLNLEVWWPVSKGPLIFIHARRMGDLE